MKKIAITFLLSTSLYSQNMEKLGEYVENIKENRLNRKEFKEFSENICSVYTILEGRESRISNNNHASDAERLTALAGLFQNRLYAREQKIPLGSYIPVVKADHQDHEKRHLAALRLMTIGVDTLIHAPALGARDDLFFNYLKNQKHMFDTEVGYEAKQEILSLLADRALRNLFPQGFFEHIAKYAYNFQDFEKQPELLFGLGLKNAIITQENGYNIPESYGISFYPKSNAIVGRLTIFEDYIDFNFRYKEIDFFKDKKNLYGKNIYGGHFEIISKEIDVALNSVDKNYGQPFLSYPDKGHEGWPTFEYNPHKNGINTPAFGAKASSPSTGYGGSSSSADANKQSPAKADIMPDFDSEPDLEKFKKVKDFFIDRAQKLKLKDELIKAFATNIDLLGEVISLGLGYIKIIYTVNHNNDFRGDHFLFLDVPNTYINDVQFIEIVAAVPAMVRVLSEKKLSIHSDNFQTKIQLRDNRTVKFYQDHSEEIINTYHEHLYDEFVKTPYGTFMQMYNLALGADNDSLTRLFRSCVLEHGCYGARMNKFSQGLFAFNSDHISLELMDLIEKADSWSAVANYLAKAGFDKGVPGPSLKDWILTTAVNNYYQPKGFKIRPNRNYYEEVFAQGFDDLELLTDQEYQYHLRLGHLKRRAGLFKSGK